MNLLQLQALTTKLEENISKVILGKETQIQKLILCLYCGGHALLEDVPGTGKTSLAKAMAKSIDCDFSRVQFTPDLLPSDLTGINFYNQKEQVFTFRQGPVFTNILLADEINRATPRTQSSLLECMEEFQVTIDGTTYPMSDPFLVIATQNPVETQGTFPLPEAQLDRFFMKFSLGYPDAESEQNMLESYREKSPLLSLQAVCTKEDILEAKAFIASIRVEELVAKYILQLVAATRAHEKIRLGASPRGALALMRAAMAYAAVSGQEYVLPDHVKAVACDVLAHRIICKGYQMGQSAEHARTVILEILDEVKVPLSRSHT